MATLSNDEWKQFCDVMNGYIYSQTLATACDFDLFTFLSKRGGANLEDVRRGLSLSQYSAKVLLLACCAAGLIRRDEKSGEYFNSAIADKILVSDSPHSIIPFVHFNHRVQQRCSVHLTRSLKEDRNAGLDEIPGDGTTLYKRLAGHPELENLFQEAMGAYTRLSPNIVDLTEFSQVVNLLDVGGGGGTNAIRLCRRYPALKITILELPSVCEIARETVNQHGLSERISCVERDIFQDPWPEHVDAILFSHLVEIFSPEKISFLYSKAFNTLPRLGRLFVWTIMANDSETGGLQAAKSSIYFLSTASGEGMAYPGKDHERWLHEVGFGSVKRFNFQEIDHGALIAQKQ
jgi:Cyclopropane fatty acid synthase and related methyltransferases